MIMANGMMDIQDAQTGGLKFAKDWLSKNNLHLGQLDEADFKTTMDAITRGIVQSWADGYLVRGQPKAARLKAVAGLLLLGLSLSASAWAQTAPCNPYAAGCLSGPGPSFNPYTQPPGVQPMPGTSPYRDPHLALSLAVMPSVATADATWHIGELNQVGDHVGFIVLQNLGSEPQTVTIEYTFDSMSGRAPGYQTWDLGDKQRLSIPLHGEVDLVNMYFSATVYFQRAGAAHATLQPTAESHVGYHEPQAVLIPKS
jgi:hypothetical protein